MILPRECRRTVAVAAAALAAGAPASVTGATGSGAAASETHAAVPAGRIVFSSDRATANRASQIYAVRASGGRSRNVSRSPQTYHRRPRVSPDGAALLFVARPWSPEGPTGQREPLVVLTDRNGSRRRVLVPGDQPEWAPDGRRVAFRTPAGEIAVIARDGGARQVVANAGMLPTWSPDGRRLAFGAPRAGTFRLRVVAADGTNERELAPTLELTLGDPDAEVAPWSWSPDGAELAVGGSFAFGGSRGIYGVRAGGVGIRTLTRGAVDWPRWSRDGKWIAFAAGEGVALDVVRRDGRGRRRVAARRGEGVSAPAWSPDGRRIAFLAGEPQQLFVVPARGGRIRQVTRDRNSWLAGAEEPVWARGGRTLYYATESDAGRPHLYAVDSDGSRLRRLTRGPFRDLDPAWSPDGRRIAFVRWRGDWTSVLVMNANGTRVRTLLPPRRRPRFDSPAWSPDGRRLAFGYGSRIAVLRLGGRAVRTIAAGRVPAWSRDGRAIAFVTRDGIRVIPARGGRSRLVVKLDPFADEMLDFAWSRDGRRFAFVTLTGCPDRPTGCQEWPLEVATRGGRTLERVANPGFGPSWAPDSRALVYTDHSDKLAIWDGTSSRQITKGPWSDTGPAWRPGRAP